MDRNSRPNMNVDIGGLALKNPVMTASGTFGYGEEFAPYVDLNKLGAIVVKGLSLEARPGNPPPRIMETASGMLNTVGLENIGVHAFIREKLPFLRGYDVAVVANIFGETLDEYVKVAGILSEADGVHALELNISCPNVTRGGIDFGTDPVLAKRITEAVKEVAGVPLIVKLTPNVTDIADIARSVEEGGADALSLINTLKGMSVDIETRRPRLRNVTGGLSGPAVKPVALRMVWEAVRAVSIPVIGIGGIMNAADAVEFLLVGASAVQVGTANFVNPCIAGEICDGIEEYMRRQGVAAIQDLTGSLRLD